MLLMNIHLSYDPDSRFVLRYDPADERFSVLAMSAGRVAEEFYKRLTAREENEDLASSLDILEFQDQMNNGYTAFTANPALTGAWEELGERLLTPLQVRIESHCRLPRPLVGCELYLHHSDWIHESWIWKDSITRVEPFLT